MMRAARGRTPGLIIATGEEGQIEEDSGASTHKEGAAV
jgi:hypothetical protein